MDQKPLFIHMLYLIDVMMSRSSMHDDQISMLSMSGLVDVSGIFTPHALQIFVGAESFTVGHGNFDILWQFIMKASHLLMTNANIFVHRC